MCTWKQPTLFVYSLLCLVVGSYLGDKAPGKLEEGHANIVVVARRKLLTEFSSYAKQVVDTSK